MYSLSSLLVTCSRRISVSLNLHHSKLWQFEIKTPKKSQKLRWTPKMPYSLKGDSSSKLSFLESSRSFSGLYPLDHQGLYSSFAALLDAVVALEVRLTLDKLWSNGRLEEIMKLENCIKPHHCQGFLGITSITYNPCIPAIQGLCGTSNYPLIPVENCFLRTYFGAQMTSDPILH